MAHNQLNARSDASCSPAPASTRQKSKGAKYHASYCLALLYTHNLLNNIATIFNYRVPLFGFKNQAGQ